MESKPKKPRLRECPKCLAAVVHPRAAGFLCGSVFHLRGDAFEFYQTVRCHERCRILELSNELTAATQDVERLKERDQRWQEEAFTCLTHCEAVGADKAAAVMSMLLYRMGIKEPPHES